VRNKEIKAGKEAAGQLQADLQTANQDPKKWSTKELKTRAIKPKKAPIKVPKSRPPLPKTLKSTKKDPIQAESTTLGSRSEEGGVGGRKDRGRKIVLPQRFRD
jgi:hypothetical protein